jgi:hypothetical protein
VDEPAIWHVRRGDVRATGGTLRQPSRVPGRQRFGYGTVYDNAEHHGDGDNGDGTTGRGTTQFLRREQRNTTDARPRGPNQASKATVAQPSRTPNEPDRDRHHPHDRPAEDAIQHHLPGHDLHRGYQRDSTERQPDQQGHQSARFLDERHQPLTASPASRTKREPEGDSPSGADSEQAQVDRSLEGLRA